MPASWAVCWPPLDGCSASVDRVVVLGSGNSHLCGRVLFEGCCHPYHNELSRVERGDRPRLYFVGHDIDNDPLQGLIDLLQHGAGGRSGDEQIEQRWGIVAICNRGDTLASTAALRVLLAELRNDCGGDTQRLAQRVVPVITPSGPWVDWTTMLGCPDVFQIPMGVDERFAVFSPMALLPAAMLGLDVMALLRRRCGHERPFSLGGRWQEHGA